MNKISRKHTARKQLVTALIAVSTCFFTQAATAENIKWRFAQDNPQLAKVSAELRALLPEQALLRSQSILTSDGPLQQRLLPQMMTGKGIPVELQLENAEGLENYLQAAGIALAFLSEDGRWATVLAKSGEQLMTLSEWPGVLRVNFAPAPIRRVGAAVSRAPKAMRSDDLRSRLGVDGSGQIIGIVSDSFNRTDFVHDADTSPSKGGSGTLVGSRPQDSGDLPAQVNLLKDNASVAFGPLTDEGAAMAELAYEVAPGSAIAFYTAGSSRSQMAEGITALCDGNATVVVDDILFLTESSYQDDLPARAISECVAKGIPFLTAAGNDGDMGYRYQYRDANADIDSAGTESVPSGNDLHNWSTNGGTDRFLGLTLAANSAMYVVLNWNQPNQSVNSNRGSQIDLDLYVTTEPSLSALNPSSLNFYTRGSQAQGETGRPSGDATEFVLLQTGAVAQTFYLAVEHFDGAQDGIPQNPATPLEFRLLITGNGEITATEYAFNGPTAWGHSASADAFVVAAVPWWESPEYVPGSYLPSTGVDPEPFTARGGELTFQFDGSGTFVESPRVLPSFAAIDGNNTTFLGSDSSQVAQIDGEPDGYNNFFGTSAAAPNAGGVVALLKEAYPDATPAQIRQALTTTTIDVTGGRAAPGDDEVTGPGLIDANAAARALADIVANDPGGSSGMMNNGGTTGGSSGGSGGGGGGGCFIATAAYGSYLAPDVQVLRNFRDRVLLRSEWGKAVVRYYYRHSPAWAVVIADSDWLRAGARGLLTPLIYALKFPVLALLALFCVVAGLIFMRRERGAACH